LFGAGERARARIYVLRWSSRVTLTDADQAAITLAAAGRGSNPHRVLPHSAAAEGLGQGQDPVPPLPRTDDG